MCKKCEIDEVTYIDDTKINLGVLGNLYGSLKLWNGKDSKKISYDLADSNNELIYNFETEINYCPYCGRKLRES